MKIIVFEYSNMNKSLGAPKRGRNLQEPQR